MQNPAIMGISRPSVALSHAAEKLSNLSVDSLGRDQLISQNDCSQVILFSKILSVISFFQKGFHNFHDFCLRYVDLENNFRYKI
uniref:Uncharacterized protein n=1 Tax=Aegilops tauschii subsp. strangulata TaxID=200361 RepID=A0A453KU10_AEGTS